MLIIFVLSYGFIMNKIVLTCILESGNCIQPFIIEIKSLEQQLKQEVNIYTTVGNCAHGARDRY